MAPTKLEQELEAIFGKKVSLSNCDEKDEYLSLVLLGQLKEVLEGIGEDPEYILNFLEWIQPSFRPPPEGIIERKKETALSIISRLNAMGHQEEVSLLLARWRRDPFFRVP